MRKPNSGYAHMPGCQGLRARNRVMQNLCFGVPATTCHIVLHSLQANRVNRPQDGAGGPQSGALAEHHRTALPPPPVIVVPTGEAAAPRSPCNGARSILCTDGAELGSKSEPRRPSPTEACSRFASVTTASGSPHPSFCLSSEACADILECYRAFVAATPFYIRMPFCIRFSKKKSISTLWSQTANPCRGFSGSSSSARGSHQGSDAVGTELRETAKPFFAQRGDPDSQALLSANSPSMPSTGGCAIDASRVLSRRSSCGFLQCQDMCSARRCVTCPASRTQERGEALGGLWRGAACGTTALEDQVRDGSGDLTTDNFLGLTELYGIELIFSQVQDYMPMRSVRLPFLQDWAALPPRAQRRSAEENDEADAEEEAHGFPFMYKIVLKYAI